MPKKVMAVGGGFVGSTRALRIIGRVLAGVVLTDILEGVPARSQREPRVRAVLAARAIIDRDVKIEHARIAHSERLCGRRRPRTHNHPGHPCRSAKGRRIISL